MKQTLGFTLLELLVAISIIAILVSIGAVAFSTAQQQGRDARRRGDIQAAQDAFEQHYAANGLYGGTCDAMDASLPGGWGGLVDPQGGGYLCSATAASYCICALLENDTGGNADNVPAGGLCSFNSSSEYYCLQNLQ